MTHPCSPDLHRSKPMLNVRLQKSQGGEHPRTPASHSSPLFHSSLTQGSETAGPGPSPSPRIPSSWLRKPAPCQAEPTQVRKRTGRRDGAQVRPIQRHARCIYCVHTSTLVHAHTLLLVHLPISVYTRTPARLSPVTSHTHTRANMYSVFDNAVMLMVIL